MPASKIRPVAYNKFSQEDISIITGDTTFYTNEQALIISSKGIPMNHKIYAEVTITDHPDNVRIRHIPIYVGIHKEPSFGVLNSDFCIGAVYYRITNSNQILDYDIAERYDAAGHATHHWNDTTHAKIPIENTVIGIGVDTLRNKITIFSDGQEFYSFYPQDFKIYEQGNDLFYITVYCPLLEEVTGLVNYGRYGTEYLPDGYWTLYQYYYYKSEFIHDFPVEMNVPGNPLLDYIYYDFDYRATIENSIAPIGPDGHRHVFLIHLYEDEMNYNDNDCAFQILPFTDRGYMTTVNLPIPTDTKVYFELRIQEGVFVEDGGYSGIPIKFGMSTNINNIQNSFIVDMYHSEYTRYKMRSYKDNVAKEYYIDQIVNPITPKQPDTLGIGLDLQNNTMTVYTEGEPFAIINFKDIDFSDPYGLFYFTILQPETEVYESTYHGICNFGEEGKDSFVYDIPDGYKSIYDYWNDVIRYYLDKNPEFECVMTVQAYITQYYKHFTCSCYVPIPEDDIANKFSVGMNRLYNTYNVVTDTEAKNNEPDMNAFDFNKFIEDQTNQVNHR